MPRWWSAALVVTVIVGVVLFVVVWFWPAEWW
jgi:hypothetical protein